MERTTTPPASPVEEMESPCEPIVLGTGPVITESSDDESVVLRSFIETPLEALITIKTRGGSHVRNAPRKTRTKKICVRLEPEERDLTTALEFSIIDPATPRRCPGAPKKTRVCVRVDLKRVIPFPNIDNM